MLIYLSLAWLAGISLGFHLAWPAISASVVVSIALIWWGLKFRKPIPMDSEQIQWTAPAGMVIGLCIITFLSAGLYLKNFAPVEQQLTLATYNGEGVVEINGVVNSSPELKERGLEVRVQVNEVNYSGEWEPISGAALLRADRSAPYQYGDLLHIQGKLETPPQFPGFDYKSYLARQGITSIIIQPKIELLESGHGNWFWGKIYSLREQLARSLTQSLPEPQASVAKGILLGLRGDIPQKLNTDFSLSGTTHLLAISGQNITILVGIILGLAVWALGRQQPAYIILPLIIIWLYTFLVGGQPPVIRAAIMATMFLIAEYAGRPGSAPTALSLSAAVMAGISPLIVWDVSFQLSFLSMVGLIYLAPHFQTLALKMRWPAPISISLSVSLGAILATWPVIAYDFGRVSLVGLPATVLTAPALPAIMITSGIAAFLGLVFAPIGIVVAWLAWLPLSYLIWAAKGFAALPAASLPVQSLSLNLIIGYYAFLSGILLAIANWKQLMPILRQAQDGILRWTPRSEGRQDGVLRQAQDGILRKVARRIGRHATLLFERISWKWATFILAPVVILVWTASLVMPPRGQLEVSFLNVRQGEAILIKTPANHYILIDGGYNAQSLNIELGKKLPFWQRKLDLVVLTTRKPEHMNGLWEVLQRYQVKELWQVIATPQKSRTTVRGTSIPAGESLSWEELLTQRDVHSLTAERGLKLKEGDYLTLEVLEPVDSAGYFAVLRLQAGKVSFLLTSAIDESIERKLMADRVNLDSTVLKVASYGAAGATSEGFLARVNPSGAVITGGLNDPFGNSSPDVVERLKQRLGEDSLYMTWQHGAIDFISDGQRLWVKTEK